MTKPIQSNVDYFQNRKRQTLKIILALCCFTVLLYFATSTISISPDYIDYKYDYLNDTSRFEIGYRAIVWLVRSIGANFDSFAYIWVAINCAVLMCCYRSATSLLFAMPTLIYLSQSFIGTQLRYSMAISVIVLLASFSGNGKYIIKVFFAISATFIHIGVLVFSAIVIFMPITERVASRNKVLFLSLCAIVVCLIILLSVFYIDQVFYLFKRNYYIDSIYEVRKSTISIVYEVLMVALCVVIFIRQNGREYYDVVAGIQVISVALAFAGIAVVGGRYLHVFWLLEPLIASRALSVGRAQGDRVIFYCGLAMALLSMSKVLTADVHIPHLF